MGVEPTTLTPKPARALSLGERADAQRRGEGGRGERELKGVSEPVRVYAVHANDAPLPFREGAGG